MSTFQWTTDLVLELINRFEEKPELWDFRSELYKNREKKHQSLKEIAKAMGTDATTIDRKMRMLIGQYRRELVRPSSKWFAFEKLSFLKTREIDERFKNRKRRPCFVSVNPDRGEPNGISSQALHRHRMNVIRQREHKSQEKDEYATYGELVAMKLKKITNSYARSTAQYHINNILYNAEIGEYDKPSRKRQSYLLRGGSSSAQNDSIYDDHSQRSSSPTKSMEYDMKVEEIDLDDD